MRIILQTLTTVIVLAGCCQQPQPAVCVPTPHEYELDAAREEDEALGAETQCGRACAQLRTVGCPEGHKIKNGDTCYHVCTSDVPRTLPVQCVIKATTVDQMRACGVRCLPVTG
jgi:hypothetical protein